MSILKVSGRPGAVTNTVSTTSRVAKAMAWLTRGYALDARDVIGDALLEEAHENMVMVRDIELSSMCEHHMLSFFGRAHIAYIPNGRMCVMMRGVEKQNSRTITAALRGVFRDDPSTRAEFLRLAHAPSGAL